MKDSKRMERGTVKENSSTKMEACMREIGIKTKWKAMELSTINLEGLLIKVSGKMINFTGRENFTTKIPNLWKACLTIVILMMLTTTGFYMRDNSMKI